MNDRLKKLDAVLDSVARLVDGGVKIAARLDRLAARRADAYDPAIVNVPLAKRGNIDNQIDKYKKEQKAEGDAKHKAGLQKMRDEKAQAAALLPQYAEPIVAKYKDKFGGEKALRSMIKDMAKSNPGRFLLLVDKFKREGA